MPTSLWPFIIISRFGGGGDGDGDLLATTVREIVCVCVLLYNSSLPVC